MKVCILVILKNRGPKPTPYFFTANQGKRQNFELILQPVSKTIRFGNNFQFILEPFTAFFKILMPWQQVLAAELPDLVLALDV